MANNRLPPECLCATFRQSVTTNILQDMCCCCCWLLLCLLNFTKPKATQLPHVVVEGKISINFFSCCFFFRFVFSTIFICLPRDAWLAGRLADCMAGWLTPCAKGNHYDHSNARYNSHNSQPASQQRQTAKTCNWRLIV